MRRELFITIFLLGSAMLIRAQTPLFPISENNKLGYIDQAGQVILPPIYANGGEFAEGLAPVRLKGKYGFIDTKGQWVIPASFDWADPFANGLAIVYENGQPYYIDHTGRPAFPCHYAAIYAFRNGRARIKTYTGKWGMIDPHGLLIIDTLYTGIGAFHDGLAMAHRKRRKKSLAAVIDTLGHVIVRPGVYESIGDFHDGYAVVETKDQVKGIIDRRGRRLFLRPSRHNCYLDADGFGNGLATISLYKYWIPEEHGVTYTTAKTYAGFLDLHNRVVLDDTTVMAVRGFSDGRAFIRREREGYRMIDTKMQPVGTTVFSNVLQNGFRQGYAIVQTEEGWGIVDTNARFVVQPAYQEIDDCGVIGKYFFFNTSEDDKGSYGVGSLDGQQVYSSGLDDFSRDGFVHGLLKVIIKGRMAFLSTQGRIVWHSSPAGTAALSDLDIDFMMRGYFYAPLSEKLPDTQDKGNSPGCIIDTTVIDSFAKEFRGFPVYVSNTTKDTCKFRTQDHRLYMKMQALDAAGDWKDIDYLPSSWCGNSYYSVSLDPGSYWKFVIPRFHGEMVTKFRIALQYIDPIHPGTDLTVYSNIIRGSINPAQFWNQRQYNPRGIMDPYYD